MDNLVSLEKKYQLASVDELLDINGGMVITIFGVTLVLTAKAIAAGVALVSAIIGGTYTVGYVIGKGWAYRK